jgi:murein DD-endopeptidase MepM/ murein hydrolase activator NlpD
MHRPVEFGLSTHIRGCSISNTFGIVRKEKNGNPRAHQGWDIAAFPGSPVLAIKDGVISFVKDDGDKGLGRHICMSFDYNGRNLFAVYGHLQATEVTAGQFVGEGERLGFSGQTGNAKGQPLSEAHLHLEIRTQPHAGLGLGNRIDPMLILGFEPIAEVLFSDMPKFEPIPR